MRTFKRITTDDVISFFDTSVNTIHDSFGQGTIDPKNKTISLAFTTVLLLRLPEVLADTLYKIDNSLFIDGFGSLLNTILEENKEYGDYQYQRTVDKNTYTFSIKTTKQENIIDVLIICYEKLLESEQQTNKFSRVMGLGTQVFKASTWWTDIDKSKITFFSSPIGPSILGIPVNDNMVYQNQAFNSIRSKAKSMTEYYEEAIKHEFQEYERIRNNQIDYFGARTPAVTTKDQLIWVETYGHCILRYKDGSPRVFVALDIYIEDVYENQRNLETLTNLIDIGLINSKVGVWFHQRYYTDGKYYFTDSFQHLMADKEEYRHDTITRLINEQISIMEELGNGYDQILHEFRTTHNDIYYKYVDKYNIIIPNKKEGKDLQWIEVRGTVIERDEEGNVLFFVGVNVDVTDNIKYQQKIEYLANHDVLTGARNRYYFESYIENSLPYSYTLFIFDLDGLKLTNDAFGHHEGDRIIRVITNLINTTFEDKIFLARIGGDEFALLTTVIDTEKIDTWLQKFDENLDKINYLSSIEINVSRGHKIVINQEVDFNKAFIQAENYMYQRKLTNRSSRKSKVLESILETLNQKTEETKEHSERLTNLAVNTLGVLKLTRESDIADITLLAKVHDIGKITIADQILNKPDLLTKDEYEIIKKHSEAGYKIIKNITDSDDVCNGVLYHHERYDGTGYPQGIKGKAIPLFARIISVVDTYDAMTHDRSYRPALSHATAIDEIKRNSGTQFDPEVVQAFLEANFKEDLT